jgi:hypothetical protein
LTRKAKISLGIGILFLFVLAANPVWGQEGNATAPAQAPANPPAKPAENLPDAPSSSKTEPSLSDLGFSPEETEANARQQALLDKRTHMLKIHQRMGLITTIPLVATVVTSMNAGGKNTSSTSRDLHHLLLRHSRAESAGDRNARPDPFA